MSYTIKELESEFLQKNEIQLSLSKDESAFLGHLINGWYKLQRYKSKSIFSRWFFRLIDQLQWKRLMMKSFKHYKDANEIFRFYIKYKGRQQLMIDANDDPGDQSRKSIRIFHRS